MTTVPSKSDRTRENLLLAAFEEIYSQGFRNASLDNILRRTGVTKGALYHHFQSKTALGYAVVDEIVYPHFADKWQRLLDENLNPIDTLLQIGQEASFPIERDVTLGCPINNLAQEMAGIDEGFRTRLNSILDKWRDTLESALLRGQRNNQVSASVDATVAAAFIVAAFEGAHGVAKCAASNEILETCLQGLYTYVESLRSPPSR